MKMENTILCIAQIAWDIAVFYGVSVRRMEKNK